MKMKHSLIAVAAAGLASAAVVTPAMAGDATAYGLVQVELASYSNQIAADDTTPGACDAPTAAGDASQTACDGLVLQDRANGRVGVKASEDLGNGWTGLAKAEFQLNTPDHFGRNLTGRDAMVGLKGAGVTIEAGTLKSAYKYTGGVKYDPFVATSLESRRTNGGMRHGAWGQGAFLDHSLAVKGKAGPVKYWLTYAPGENDGAMTASVMFTQDMFEVFVAMADQGDRGGATTESNTKFGGAFKTGPHKIKLQYEMVDRDLTPSRDETYLFLGYELKMGKNIIVAQLGQYDGDGLTRTYGTPPVTNKVDTSYFALGVIHKFTKQTRLFAGYRSSDADDESEEDVITVGLRKDF